MQPQGLEKDRVVPLAVAASFVAMSSAFRLIKHIALGSVQFVNFPAVFTILGGLLLGPAAGFLIGFLSFLVSDIFIGFAGVWTIATSLSMGLIGTLTPFACRIRNNDSLARLAVSAYLLLLLYDVLSSVLLLVPTTSLQVAFSMSIIGLFLPSSVVFYPVGLVTEAVTTSLIVLIYPRVKGIWRQIGLWK